MQTAAGLQVQLERPAQVGRPDSRCRNPGAGIDEGNPAGAGAEVLAQVRRQPHEPTGVRGELGPAEQLGPQFPGAAIPMALTTNAAKHVSVRKAEQRQVVSLAPAENGQPIGGPRAQPERLRSGLKSFTDAPVPNAGGSQFKIGVMARMGFHSSSQDLRSEVD